MESAEHPVPENWRAAAARREAAPAAAIEDMLPFSHERHLDAHRWLVQEAELLDDRRVGDWLARLTDDVVSTERTDVLRPVDGILRLARRHVLVDESVLRTENLAVLL